MLPPLSQDRECLVQEWEDYLGQMKKVRTKGYVELTVGSDRARVSHMIL